MEALFTCMGVSGGTSMGEICFKDDAEDDLPVADCLPGACSDNACKVHMYTYNVYTHSPALTHMHTHTVLISTQTHSHTCTRTTHTHSHTHTMNMYKTNVVHTHTILTH